MIDLPKDGDRVKVWPMRGLLVQSSSTPIGDGGMALPPDGREITWSPFAYRQLLHGEICFSDPRDPKVIAAEKAALEPDPLPPPPRLPFDLSSSGKEQ